MPGNCGPGKRLEMARGMEYKEMRQMIIRRRAFMDALAQAGKKGVFIMAEKQDKVKKLYRSKKNRILGGVCAGVAEYLGIDPNIVRVIWVIVSLVYGLGLLAYIVMWLLVPEGQ